MTHILITLFPITILIIMLFSNILLFNNSMAGPNQLALILSALCGALIAYKRNISMHVLFIGVIESIKSSMNAIMILLIIGGLTSTWIISGIVPAMIYYGIELINPQFFLFTTCFICAIVSIATGSSWTTAATIGIALVGIGDMLGLHKGLVAGAIISGAYFGDKMSPLSETTNLAPSVSGSNLIEHIKYMTYTTVPAILITLSIFFIIGLKSSSRIVSLDQIDGLLETIKSTFYIGPELFILPIIIVVLIYKRMPAIQTLLIGVLLGIVFAYFFQGPLILEISVNNNLNKTTTILNTIFYGTDITTTNMFLNNLLEKDGVKGMLWIVMLVISSMTFGGVMHKGDFLKKITNILLPKSPTNFELIKSTSKSCIFFNITTCDQYMAIVIPGRMFKEIYQKYKLAPVNLSRTIEDSGTVTSVLVPWNSCAAYHAEILAINPIAYLPFCFFNILSPLITLCIAYINIKIKKIEHD